MLLTCVPKPCSINPGACCTRRQIKTRWSFYGKARAGWGNLGHVGTLDKRAITGGEEFYRFAEGKRNDR